MCREIGRRGGCCECYLDHPLPIINLKAWMMRGFIDMHLTSLQVERRNNQSDTALAQRFFSELCFQHTAQGLRMVLGKTDATQPTSKPTPCENGRSQLLVKVQDISS